MSKLEQLIQELCPNGVEFKYVWEITAWDKKFNAVDNSKQKKIVKYHYYLAADLKALENENGTVKILTTSITDLWANEDDVMDTLSDGEIVCIPWGGNPVVQYHKGKFITGDNRIATSIDTSVLDNKYLYYCLQNKLQEIATFYRGSGIKHPDMSKVLDLKIPVPPLEVQREIVRILDNFTLLTAELTAELTTRKKQYDYYTEHLMNFGENVKILTLGEIGSVKMCKRILKAQTNTKGGIPFYKIGTFGKEPDAYIEEEVFEDYKSKYSYPKKGDILISCSGTIGRTVIFDGEPAYFQDSNIVWLEHDGTIVNNKYLLYCYKKQPWQISTGGTISRLYNDNILKAKIPVPPLEEQERIVGILERFDKLCNDISEGLPAEIEARQKQYEYYRDKLLTFKELSE